MPLRPTSPMAEAVLMIDPPPLARSAGMAYLMPRKTPRRFTATRRSNTSSSVSSSGWWASIPALLNTTSSRPNVSTAAANIAFTSAACETSARTAIASWPISAAADSWCPLTSAQTTLAPSAANSSAEARPMPDPAPVTTATLPSSFPMTLRFGVDDLAALIP